MGSLEEQAYYAVLKALGATNRINFDTDLLLTELRTELGVTNAQHTQWLEDVDNDEEVQALADHSKGRGAVQPKRPQQVAHRPAAAPAAPKPKPKPRAPSPPPPPPRERPSASGAPRPKKRRTDDTPDAGAALVGRPLEKFSVGAGTWMQYTITDYNASTGCHCLTISTDTGDFAEWLNLRSDPSSWRWPEARRPQPQPRERDGGATPRGYEDSLFRTRLNKAGYPELCKMRDALTLREREVFAELLAATGGSADALEAPYGWQHKLMGLEQREREIVEQLEACGVHVASA